MEQNWDNSDAVIEMIDNVLEPHRRVRRRSTRRQSTRRLGGSVHNRRMSVRRKKSSAGRRLHSRDDGNQSVKLYELPPPSLSQRRRGSINTLRRRPTLPLFGEDDYRNEPVDQEMTNEEMYELLQTHNQDTTGGGTIKLPSDILHRRKSRFETEDLFAPLERSEDNVDTTVDITRPISFSELARLAAYDRGRGVDEQRDEGCAKLSRDLSDFFQDATILNTTLSKIQGRYGSAIMEYFSFVKWLFMINFFIAIMTLPILVPQIYAMVVNGNDTLTGMDNTTKWLAEASDCSERYTNDVQNVTGTRDWWYIFLDIVQGSGHLEDTILFYGNYKNNLTFDNIVTGYKTTYNLGFAFMCVTGAIFIISFGLILHQLSNHLQSAMVATDSGEFTAKFSSAVLSSWDFALMDRSAVKLKKELIKQELTQHLSDQDYQRKLRLRTTPQRVGLYIVRVIVNLVTIGCLIGVSVGIYKAQQFSDEQLARPVSEVNREFLEEFALEYLPTIIITLAYIVVPIIFNVLVKLEQYRPTIVINITMARILVLRLFSLFFLLIMTMIKLNCLSKPSDRKNCLSRGECGNVLFDLKSGSSSLTKCWETYIGQQIYKLMLLDFIVMLLITVLVEFPRQWIFKKLENKVALVKWVGQQEFDMPKNVMDVLYNQTLCWIGVFFSPLIPVFITAKLFVFFWIKRASLFYNQKPSPTLSKSSDVYSFFLWVMLISLVLAYIVLITYIQFVTPSQSCGPFRVHAFERFKIINTIGLTVDTFPGDLRRVVEIVPTIPFAISLILILGVVWYYYVTKNHGLNAKSKLYIQQLSLNVKDKQFILKRVNKALNDMNSTAAEGRQSTAKLSQVQLDQQDGYGDREFGGETSRAHESGIQMKRGRIPRKQQQEPPVVLTELQPADIQTQIPRKKISVDRMARHKSLEKKASAVKRPHTMDDVIMSDQQVEQLRRRTHLDHIEYKQKTGDHFISDEEPSLTEVESRDVSVNDGLNQRFSFIPRREDRTKEDDSDSTSSYSINAPENRGIIPPKEPDDDIRPKKLAAVTFQERDNQYSSSEESTPKLTRIPRKFAVEHDAESQASSEYMADNFAYMPEYQEEGLANQPPHRRGPPQYFQNSAFEPEPDY